MRKLYVPLTTPFGNQVTQCLVMTSSLGTPDIGVFFLCIE